MNLNQWNHLPPKRAIGFAVHFLMAAILGPYLVLVVFSFLEFGARAEVEPVRILLVQPLGMLAFGFPVVFVFSVLSVFPLLGVLGIKTAAKRKHAFLLVGGLLGLLVGVGLLWSGMELGSGLVLTIAACLIGVWCGHLDWLAWRQPAEPEN